MGNAGIAAHAAALMQARAEGLLAGGLDPEGVHDRRVASRRLRVACELFEPLLPEASTRRCAKRLRAFSSGLGGLRELDVHQAALMLMRSQSQDIAEQAALEHLLEWVTGRRRRALDKVEGLLSSREPKELAKELRDLATRVAEHPGPASTATFAWSALQPRVQESYGALPVHRGQEDTEAMHATRTRLKQLRYALEYLEPAFQDGFRHFLAQTKQLQDALGHHHDEAVLCALIGARLQKVADRGRTTLAGGLQRSLHRAELRRRELYKAFRTFVPQVPVEALTQSLWVSLDPLQGRWEPAP